MSETIPIDQRKPLALFGIKVHRPLEEQVVRLIAIIRIISPKGHSDPFRKVKPEPLKIIDSPPLIQVVPLSRAETRIEVDSILAQCLPAS